MDKQTFWPNSHFLNHTMFTLSLILLFILLIASFSFKAILICVMLAAPLFFFIYWFRIDFYPEGITCASMRFPFKRHAIPMDDLRVEITSDRDGPGHFLEIKDIKLRTSDIFTRWIYREHTLLRMASIYKHRNDK